MSRLAHNPIFQVAAALASIASFVFAAILLWHDVYPIGQFAVLLACIFIALAMLATQRRHPESEAADRRLFLEFIALLPSSDAIEFLREHPFDASYEDDVTRPLYRFQYTWGNAEHVFHDRRIESAHRAFHAATTAFIALEARHTFIVQPGWRRAYPDHNLDFEDDENAFAFRAIEALNDAADEVHRAHQRFVLVARKRLGI